MFLMHSIIIIIMYCGLLTLTNDTTINGTFGGNWSDKIEVVKGVLENDV